MNAPLFRRWRHDEWVDVPASEWRKLAPKLEREAKLAPRAPGSELSGDDQAQAVDYGKKGRRLQRSLEKRQVHLSTGWFKLSHLGENFTLWTGSPLGWGPDDVVAAFGQSRRILREIGLPRDAYAVWCYREQGQWWVLIDRDGSSQPQVQPTQPGTEGIDFFSLYYREGLIDILKAVLPQFLDDYGGHGGAFEWAWQVRSIIKEIVGFHHKSRLIARWLGQLTDLPEWALLRRAAAATGAEGLEPANLFCFIESVAKSGGREAVGPAFIEGFQLGHALGALDVMRAVAQGELDRNSAKEERRKARAKSFKKAEDQWPSKNHEELALLISREIETDSELGRCFKKAELGMTKKSLARLIAEHRKIPQM